MKLETGTLTIESSEGVMGVLQEDRGLDFRVELLSHERALLLVGSTGTVRLKVFPEDGDVRRFLAFEQGKWNARVFEIRSSGIREISDDEKP